MGASLAVKEAAAAGRERLAMEAFARALENILLPGPNAGVDRLDTLLKLRAEHRRGRPMLVLMPT